MASALVVPVLVAATAVTISLVSTDVTGVVFAESILFAKPDATETEHDLFVQFMDNNINILRESFNITYHNDSLKAYFFSHRCARSRRQVSSLPKCAEIFNNIL